MGNIEKILNDWNAGCEALLVEIEKLKERVTVLETMVTSTNSETE